MTTDPKKYYGHDGIFPYKQKDTYLERGLTKREYYTSLFLQSIIPIIEQERLNSIQDFTHFDERKFYQKAVKKAVNYADELINQLNPLP
jgi:hypothetical protein